MWFGLIELKSIELNGLNCVNLIQLCVSNVFHRVTPVDLSSARRTGLSHWLAWCPMAPHAACMANQSRRRSPASTTSNPGLIVQSPQTARHIRTICIYHVDA